MRLGPAGDDPAADWFALAVCPEICGATAEPRTPGQWKERGNALSASGDLRGAMVAYTAGLTALAAGAAAVDGAGGTVPHALQSALLSNRAGCHASQEDWASSLADGRSAAALRPSWHRGHYRQAVALLALKRLGEALVSADWAEKLEPTATHTALKMAVLECALVEAAAGGGRREAGEARLESARDDTLIRVQRRQREEAAREDAELAARGQLPEQITAKETPAEYAARRDRRVRLEKVEKGLLKPAESEAVEAMEQEIRDHQMAFGRQGLSSEQQAARSGHRPSWHATGGGKRSKGM